MPRLSNLFTRNSPASRFWVRQHLIRLNPALLNSLMRTRNIYMNHRSSPNNIHRALVNTHALALKVFTNAGYRSALPSVTNPRASFLKLNDVVGYIDPRRRRNNNIARKQSANNRKINVPPARNIKFAKGPNGKPVLVYFPNN
jgi:hypothetical protein